MSGRFDAGLQPERTALAWRRTALAVLVGSALLGRLLAPRSGTAAVVLAVAGCGAGAALHVAAGARGRGTVRALLRDGHLRAGPGAGLLAATAGVAVLLGVSATVLVLSATHGGILTSR